MGAADWAVILTGVGGALTWATFIARVLWTFRGKWDETNQQLVVLQRELADAIREQTRIEQRLERHLDWHDRQQGRRRFGDRP